LRGGVEECEGGEVGDYRLMKQFCLIEAFVRVSKIVDRAAIKLLL